MKNQSSKPLFQAVSVLLVLVFGFFAVTGVYFGNAPQSAVASSKTRTIVLDGSQQLDVQSVLDEYDDAELVYQDSVVSFTGSKPVDLSMLSQIDYISDLDLTFLQNYKIKYGYSYDIYTNVVTVSAEFCDEFGNVERDSMCGLAFINEQNEIDAVLCLDDGENVLLSDLRNAGLLDNVGLLSKIVKAVSSVATAVVATVVSAVATTAVLVETVVKPIAEDVGIGAATVAAIGAVAVGVTVGVDVGVVTCIGVPIVIETTEKAAAKRNYNHNKTLENPTDYIDDQHNRTDWWFGVGNVKGNELTGPPGLVSMNGCGVIAIFNVLHAMGMNPNFAEIIHDVESDSGTFACGYFGTDPTHFSRYFKSKNIPVKQYFLQSRFEAALSKMSDGQYAIMCFWNVSGNISRGAHNIEIEKNHDESDSDKKYFMHNNGEIKDANTVSDMMNGGNGGFICGVIVGEEK